MVEVTHLPDCRHADLANQPDLAGRELDVRHLPFLGDQLGTGTCAPAELTALATGVCSPVSWEGLMSNDL